MVERKPKEDVSEDFFNALSGIDNSMMRNLIRSRLVITIFEKNNFIELYERFSNDLNYLFSFIDKVVDYTVEPSK